MRRRVITVSILLGFICSSFLIFNAFAANSKIKEDKLKNFKKNHGINTDVVFNKKSGLPYHISKMKTKEYKGKPDEIARSFLSENSSFLGINPGNVKVDVCQDSAGDGLKYVKFKQYHKGLPVHGSKIIIHTKKDKTIDRMSKSMYYPNLDVDIVPSISIEEAAKIVKEDLGIDELFSIRMQEHKIELPKGTTLKKEPVPEDKSGSVGVQLDSIMFAEGIEPVPDDKFASAGVQEDSIMFADKIKLEKTHVPVKPELVIYPKNEDEAYLCWQFLFYLEKPLGSWCYFIDAHTGKIIHHFNGMQNYTTSGYIYGYIWPENGSDDLSFRLFPNVWVDAQNWNLQWYRSNYTYGNDWEYTLNYDSGKTYYRYAAYTYGKKCRVWSYYYDQYPGMNSPYYLYNNVPDRMHIPLDFDRSSTYSAMDCVNIYYHVSKSIREYYEGIHHYSLGYSIIAQAHFPESGSRYEPIEKYLLFGIGDEDTWNNPARSRDLILHELQHAFTCSIWNCFPDITRSEKNTLNEAYSDYFACTQADSGLFGEWAFKNQSQVRDIYFRYKYPDNWLGLPYSDSIYTDMLVPASALWRLRSEIGKNAADNIIFRSIFEEPESLFDLRRACLNVASNLGYNSDTLDTIDTVFAFHGI